MSSITEKAKNIPILVVSHNHAKYLPNLISSLTKFGYINTYFCDAASTDNSVKIIKSSVFGDQLLAKKKLESFSKNNNDLIKFFNIQADYVLILNPDTYIEIDFLSQLYEYAINQQNAMIIAPKILYPDGTMQESWKRFPRFFDVLVKRTGLKKKLKAGNQHLREGKIDWCLGACMLVKYDFILERGMLFDERYRLYCEDIDICFDAYSRGYDVVGLESVNIFHYLNEKSYNQIFSKYNLWNLTSIIKFFIKWNFKYLKVIYAKNN